MDQGERVWRTSGVGGSPPDIRTAATTLAIALLALNVLDVAVTNFNIDHLAAVEINPIMAPLIGTPWAILAKIGIPIVIIALAAWGRSVRFFGLLRVVVAIYLVVVIIGIGQIAYVVA